MQFPEDRNGIRKTELNDVQFYHSLLAAMKVARWLIILDAPFVTYNRVNLLAPHLRRAIAEGKRVCIFVRPNAADAPDWAKKSHVEGVCTLQHIGCHVTENDNGGKVRHEKICILDDQLGYFGALNIFSNNGKSSELMVRFEDWALVRRLIRAYNLDKCGECAKFRTWSIHPRTIEEELQDFGLVIAARRTELGIRQAEMAAALQIQPPSLSGIERGQRFPSLRLLWEISQYLGLHWQILPWYQVPTLGEIAREKRSAGGIILP